MCECISLHLARQSSRGHVNIATSLPEEIIECCISTLTKAIALNFSTVSSSRGVSLLKNSDGDGMAQKSGSGKRGSKRKTLGSTTTDVDSIDGDLHLDCEEPTKSEREAVEIPVKLLTAEV